MGMSHLRPRPVPAAGLFPADEPAEAPEASAQRAHDGQGADAAGDADGRARQHVGGVVDPHVQPGQEDQRRMRRDRRMAGR